MLLTFTRRQSSPSLFAAGLLLILGCPPPNASAYPLDTWTLRQELTAFDAANFDYFGTPISIDGDTAIIGASGQNTGHGAAYVFTRSAGVWSLQQELHALDGAQGDFFGVSVAVNGNTAIIGASQKSHLAGAAYVFTRAGNTWTQLQKLTAVGTTEFGESVALCGDTAVIGAPWTDSYGVSIGVAYVFTRSGSSWSEQQKLIASDANANDGFGFSVSLSGDTAVIGAPTRKNLVGGAYVFTRSAGVWSQQQKLVALDAQYPDAFGIKVSLDGDTVLIGAFGRDSYRGAAFVFTRTQGSWTQLQKLTASDSAPYHYFGYSVSLSGDRAAVSTRPDNASGAAYLFHRSGSSWTQQKVTSPAAAASEHFGSSLSINGKTAIVGAEGANSSKGIAYVFSALDTTAPTVLPAISGTLGPNDWYRSDVKVDWSVSDPESGIANSSGCTTTALTSDTSGVTLTCSATNGEGLCSSVPVTIKIDKTPPMLSGMPGPNCTLWPANKKMVTVATVSARDALSGLVPGAFQVTVTSNQPVSPSDPKYPDFVITQNGGGDFVVQLRADRLGNSGNRIYTVTATARDQAGNTETNTATCTVPHDQGK